MKRDYRPATSEDLAQTVAEVEALGSRCLALTADVRDLTAMHHVVDTAITDYGQIDIVIANAGIAST